MWLGGWLGGWGNVGNKAQTQPSLAGARAELGKRMQATTWPQMMPLNLLIILMHFKHPDHPYQINS